jgi:hypothetical protein
VIHPIAPFGLALVPVLPRVDRAVRIVPPAVCSHVKRAIVSACVCIPLTDVHVCSLRPCYVARVRTYLPVRAPRRPAARSVLAGRSKQGASSRRANSGVSATTNP